MKISRVYIKLNKLAYIHTRMKYDILKNHLIVYTKKIISKYLIFTKIRMDEYYPMKYCCKKSETDISCVLKVLFLHYLYKNLYLNPYYFILNLEENTFSTIQLTSNTDT